MNTNKRRKYYVCGIASNDEVFAYRMGYTSDSVTFSFHNGSYANTALNTDSSTGTYVKTFVSVEDIYDAELLDKNKFYD